MSPTLASQVMKDIAMYLLDEVEAQKLTPDRAAEISKMVPQILDEAMTDDKTYEGITKLIASFPELAKLLNEYAVKKDDVATAKLLEETQKSLDELKKDIAPPVSPAPIQPPVQATQPIQSPQPTQGAKLV